MDSQTEETQSKSIINEVAPSIKDIGVAILRHAGLTQAQTAEVIDRTRDRVKQIDRKLPKGFDLTSPKAVRLAARAHEKILACFVHPDKVQNDSTIELKGSDVTKAIDRVYDRAQPTHKGEDKPSSVTFIQVNIEGY